MTHLYVAFIGGGILLLIGLLLLRAARSADEKNYIIQKATPLALDLINVRDDVWLRGTAECAGPLVAPYFKAKCLHFEYKLEEKEVEFDTDSKGHTRVRTRWVTRHEEKRSARFSLREGEHSIEIKSSQATYENLEYKVHTDKDLRHSLTFLPYPTEISCIGSVSEDKHGLEPYGKIPLLVTPLTRDVYVKKAERGESWLRFFGFMLFGLGAMMLLYGLFDVVSWPVDSGRKFSSTIALVSACGAAALVFLTWAMYMYNTFVQYRRRVENAWHNIDPDMKMRHELIPSLVEVVKGYLGHEKSVLESIAEQRKAAPNARGQVLAQEAQLAKSSARLLAVVEAYPDIKANEVVAKLFRELKALEEKIAYSREFYNRTVKEYNDNVMVLPRGILARIFGFRPYKYFEL